MPFDRIFLDELSSAERHCRDRFAICAAEKERRELFRSVSLPQ